MNIFTQRALTVLIKTYFPRATDIHFDKKHKAMSFYENEGHKERAKYAPCYCIIYKGNIHFTVSIHKFNDEKDGEQD